MSNILTFDLTLYGQEVAGISVPIGSTVQFNLTCEDPVTREAIDLGTDAIVMAVNPLDARGNPTQPSIISREATVTSALAGECYVPWSSGDTVPGGSPVSPGKYSIEVWIESGSGDRQQTMATGHVQLTASGRLPDALVTPLPAQPPLGQAVVATYDTFADFPSPTGNLVGTFAFALDTNTTYVAENGGWQSMGGLSPGSADQFLRTNDAGNATEWVTLTLDMISPAFAVTLAMTGVSNPLEAGASIVNPQFTDTHNQTPSAASLTGPDSVTHTISPATLTSVGYGGAANTFPAQTFTDPGTTLNQSFTWTYSATAGGITRTATTSRTFERRAYYDMVDVATYNAAFITALASTRLQSGFETSYAFAAGDGTKYAHLAIPTGWGDPSVFKEHVSQLPVAWTKVASGISVTNTNGVVISYEIWRAPQANTSAFTYDVS